MTKKINVFIVVLLFVSSVFAQDLEAELATSDSSASTSSAADEVSNMEVPLEISEPVVTEPTTVSESVASTEDEVIVERAEDFTLPYSERRGRWGIIFSVNYENYYPSEFFSVIQNDKYQFFLDKNIPLAGAEIGLKYNFSLGSLALLAGYAQGSVDDMAGGIEDITVSITKAALNLSLDNIFSEPYVVPFVQVGVHTIDWSETGTTLEERFTSEPNYHYKAGFSFQLNWIEKAIDSNSPGESLRSSGLENTYLDVFYTSYAQPAKIADTVGAEGEGDLQSAQYGVGLKLEF